MNKQDSYGTVNYCLERISKIQDNRTTLQQDREKAMAYFYAEKNFDEGMAPKKGFSSHVSPDVRSKISSLLPMLLKPLVSSDEIFQIMPRTEEDVEGARDMEALVDYYMRTRNSWGKVVYDVLKDACLMKNGYIGYEWKHHEKKILKEFEGWTYEELMAYSSDENFEILKVTKRIPEEPGMEEPEKHQPQTDEYDRPLVKGEMPSEDEFIYDVEAEVTLDDYHYPCIRAIKAEDVGHDMEAQELSKCSFVWENCYLEEWEIREKYGDKKFEEIKDCARGYLEDGYTYEDIRFSRVYDLGGYTFMYEDDMDVWTIRQCYFRDQKTGNPKIAVLCGPILIEEEDNNYGRPPIVSITTYRMAHRVLGLSQFELIKEYQKLNTQLKREIMNNIYYMNRSRWAYNPMKIKLSDFLAGNRPGGAIPVQGNVSEALQHIPGEQLPDYLPQLIQMWENQEEIDTGITKYNQGTDSKSLNKTARGLQAILSMSMQRVEMMLTIISWGLVELTQEIVNLLIENMDKTVAIRILNKEWKKLSPDNIAGSYDISIKVGIGIIEKDFIIQQLQQLIQIGKEMTAMGIFNSENAYNLMKLLIQSMGFKNFNEYITDPKLKESVMMLVQLIIQTLGPQPQVLQLVQQVIQALGLSEEEMQSFTEQLQGQGQGQPQGPSSPMSPLPPEGGAAGMMNQPG